MGRNEFLTKLEEKGISLDESRMHEVNYYFKRWLETQHEYADFDAYIAWMTKG